MKRKYMKTKRVVPLLAMALAMVLLQCVIKTVYAQPLQRQPEFCGPYVIDRNALNAALGFEQHGTNSTQGVSYQVRVYFHILANDDGSNPAATQTQVMAEFNQLAADYSVGGICFIYAGTNTVNNTFINNNFFAGTDSATDFNPYRISGCINVFYMQAIGGNNPSCNCGYGGITLGIPNTFCLVAHGNLGYRHSTTHEVGHCLGLLHTFEPANGHEDINGSNSATTADLITDTPADPYYDLGQSCFLSAFDACSYSGSCKDPNGQTNFAPQYNNIMGYWGTNSCFSTMTFTAGQFTRAKSYLSTNSDLENCQSSSSVVTLGPGFSQGSGYYMNSSTNQVNTSGSVVFNGTTDASFTGSNVALEAGFSASPGTGGIVLIQAADCNTSFINSIRADTSVVEEADAVSMKNTLFVYPNPASNIVNLSITMAKDEQDVVLQLFDMTARKVKEMTLENLIAGKQNIQLSVQAYSAGIYYLVLRTKNGMMNAKIVIVK